MGGLPEPTTICPSRTGMAARITSVSVHGSDIIVTIAVGADRGVSPDWIILRPPRKCAIIRVDAARTIARCTGTPDQISANPHAVLCAPP